MLMYTQPSWHISADPFFWEGVSQRFDEAFIVWLLYQPTCSCGCCIGQRFFFATACDCCIGLWQRTRIGRRVPAAAVSADVWLLYRLTFFYNRFDGPGIARSVLFPRSCREVCLSCAPNLDQVAIHQGRRLYIASCPTTCVSLLTASKRDFLAKGVFYFSITCY